MSHDHMPPPRRLIDIGDPSAAASTAASPVRRRLIVHPRPLFGRQAVAVPERPGPGGPRRGVLARILGRRAERRR